MERNLKSAEQHKSYAEGEGVIPIAIVTVSDSRTPETDTNYVYLKEVIEAAGHAVVDYTIVKDEPDQVDEALEKFAAGDARVILFNGGTGLSQRDRTFDVLSRKMEKNVARIRGDFSDVELRSSRRGRDDVSRHGRDLQRHRHHLDPRLPGRGAARLGKATRP